MTDYKDTLNLPKTAFPMKASLAQREPARLEGWQKQNLYQKVRQSRQAAEKDNHIFILHDGPPYANGNIHVGHAMNKILKDIVVKSKRLEGYAAPYVPGWDCHGLPIELNVEKKHGKPGVKISATEFRQKCREYAAKQVAGQAKEFERLGVLGDWQNPYLIMDFNYEANTLRTLADIIEQGHLVKGAKPVHWCCDCASSLAEAEVEYKDKVSDTVTVRFPVVDVASTAKTFGLHDKITDPVSVLIWTTTPWTLPANQAVALGPEIDYGLFYVEEGDQHEWIIVAEDLAESVKQLRSETITTWQPKGFVTGSQLAGLKLQHPFDGGREVPIILGSHVTVDAGTGCVHTAPAHGQEDFEVGLEAGLEVYNPVDGRGIFLESTPYVGGQFYSKANPIIIDLLSSNQALWHHAKLEHSYPHCWRHKSPLIFRATPQWFISMTAGKLRERAMRAIRQRKWTPSTGEARIAGMIADRPDWCISRQRVWGTPLPLFVHKQTGELHPDTIRIVRQVADLVAQKGIEGWFESEAEDWIGPEVNDYDRVLDTLDVWFDSGASHACVLENQEQWPGLHFPADLYLEGSDQHRGWFQTSLLISLARQAPDVAVGAFRHVLTHGFVVNEQGHKMSKSLGNAIEPQQVIKTLGADILRLWAASSDYRFEVSLSDSILKQVSDTYRRIRNTARYLLANLNEFDFSSNGVKPENMLAFDRWAVWHTKNIQSLIRSAYERYDFVLVTQHIHHFCAQAMGSLYLDVTKDRQYTCQVDSVARRSAQTACYHILHALIRWIAPILSFTADELWEFLPGEKPCESVFMEVWYDDQDFLSVDIDPMSEEQWQKLFAIRTEVNKAIEYMRAQNECGSALEIEATLFVDSELRTLCEHFIVNGNQELRYLLIVSDVTIQPLTSAPDNAKQTEYPGLMLQLETSKHAKCVRCWHYRDDVGSDEAHAELCGRCVQNVAGSGEVRRYI